MKLRHNLCCMSFLYRFFKDLSVKEQLCIYLDSYWLPVLFRDAITTLHLNSSGLLFSDTDKDLQERVLFSNRISHVDEYNRTKNICLINTMIKNKVSFEVNRTR